MKSYSLHLVVALGLLVAFFLLNHSAYMGRQEFDARVTASVTILERTFRTEVPEAERRQALIGVISQEETSSFWQSMKEHFAEACLIAALMIVAVEGPTRFFAAKEQDTFVRKISDEFKSQVGDISSNVWNAIFKKLVPDVIAVEIQKILKSDTCRIRPTYIITLTDGSYSGLNADEIIVRRQLSYGLRNLTGDRLDYPLAFSVMSHTRERTLRGSDGKDSVDVVLPRIREVKINKVSSNLSRQSRTSFKETVTLPVMTSDAQAVEVYSDVEEILKVSDRTLYVQSTPCAGIDVVVTNNSTRVRLLTSKVYLTSGVERLVLGMEGRWTYDGGLLSGTALSVAWEPVPKDEEKS